MANESNLISLRDRTQRERKEIASKGAKATNRKKADKKKFAELFNSYLDKKVTNEQIKEQMKQFGFKDKECTNKNAIVFAQYKEALKGSTQAFVAVRDTMGEKPVEQIQNINPPVINIERPKDG